MTKEQFIKAYCKYMDEHKYIYQQHDWLYEWSRYKIGRSWCNEFFNTTEGAKYVDRH